MTSDPITAEQVRRILLVLAADEIRIAREAREADPPPVTIETLREHADSHAFCTSLAREAANDTRFAAAEQSIAAHLGDKPRRRP